jgi:hypothetical protein
MELNQAYIGGSATGYLACAHVQQEYKLEHGTIQVPLISCDRRVASLQVNEIFSNFRTTASQRCQNTLIICAKIDELESYSHIIGS